MGNATVKTTKATDTHGAMITVFGGGDDKYGDMPQQGKEHFTARMTTLNFVTRRRAEVVEENREWAEQYGFDPEDLWSMFA